MTHLRCSSEALDDISNVAAVKSKDLQGPKDEAKHLVMKSQQENEQGVVFGHGTGREENICPLNPDFLLDASGNVSKDCLNITTASAFEVANSVKHSAFQQVSNSIDNGTVGSVLNLLNPSPKKAGMATSLGSSNKVPVYSRVESSCFETEFNHDDALGEPTLNKQHHTVETKVNLGPSTSNSMALDIFPSLHTKKENRDELHLVTAVANQAPPALVTSSRSRENSATLLTKHIRGYLARMKMAQIFRTKFTSIARDAASAADERNVPMPQMDGTEDSLLSTIQGDEGKGEEFALKDSFCTRTSLESQAGFSNQAPADADAMNALSQEIMKSMILSSGEEESIGEAGGEIDLASIDYSLTGLYTKGHVETSSPIFAGSEISNSFGLFENGSLDAATNTKTVAAPTMSLPHKVSASPVAFVTRDGSCSKSGDPLSNIPQSIEIKKGVPQPVHAPGSASTECNCDETDNGTVVYLGTFSKDFFQVKEEARADYVDELEATFQEMHQKTEHGELNQLLEKKLQKSNHKISLLKENHNALYSTLKAKHSTTLSEKLAAEAKLIYLHKKNAFFFDQIFALRGENEYLKLAVEAKEKCLHEKHAVFYNQMSTLKGEKEALMFQKLAAEVETEWVKTNLFGVLFCWVQILLLLLLLSM